MMMMIMMMPMIASIVIVIGFTGIWTWLNGPADILQRLANQLSRLLASSVNGRMHATLLVSLSICKLIDYNSHFVTRESGGISPQSTVSIDKVKLR
ncbi:hypothetical protein BDF22DRAFT_673051 [Syncephalis plumigaleata]|nr:hypothetical protein BDF22DRAFT_673051 [Syncephalis plumigaleata]